MNRSYCIRKQRCWQLAYAATCRSYTAYIHSLILFFFSESTPSKKDPSGRGLMKTMNKGVSMSLGTITSGNHSSDYIIADYVTVKMMQ
jgi:hypothetical protein